MLRNINSLYPSLCHVNSLSTELHLGSLALNRQMLQNTRQLWWLTADHWFSGGNPIILKGQTSSEVSKYCFEHSHKLGIEQLMCLDVFTGASRGTNQKSRTIYIKKMVLFSHILKHKYFSTYRQLIGQIVSLRVKVENTHPSTLGWQYNSSQVHIYI